MINNGRIEFGWSTYLDFTLESFENYVLSSRADSKCKPPKVGSRKFKKSSHTQSRSGSKASSVGDSQKTVDPVVKDLKRK
jgi:hypothetical protein